MLKQAIKILTICSIVGMTANVQAAWFIYNGKYYWGSVECDAFSKGGGPKENGRVSCSADVANYLVWCVNPSGRISGEGVPSQGHVAPISQPLDEAEELGNGKLLTTIELPLELDGTDAIEGLLGTELCKQKRFYPIAAVLQSFQSTITSEQCSSGNVSGGGECTGGTWETQSAKVFFCEVPGASEIETYPWDENIYPPESGDELDCNQVSN